MNRGRARFQKRHAWLCCSKMGVMIVKDCNISREITGHLHAITGFIREKIFRLELVAPENRYFSWKWGWVLRSSWGYNRRI